MHFCGTQLVFVSGLSVDVLNFTQFPSRTHLNYTLTHLQFTQKCKVVQKVVQHIVTVTTSWLSAKKLRILEPLCQAY